MSDPRRRGFAPLQYRQAEWICFSEIITIESAVEWYPDEIPVGLLTNRLQKPRAPVTVDQQPKPRGRPKSTTDKKPQRKLEKAGENKLNESDHAAQRAQQKELEKRRLAYRQFWLASVKLPIQDALLQSGIGLRRLGPPDSQAKMVLPPSRIWDSSTQLSTVAQDCLYIWLFTQTFGPLLKISRFEINLLSQGLLEPGASGLCSEICSCLLEFVIPALIQSAEAQLIALEIEEAAYVKLNGKQSISSRKNLLNAVDSARSELLAIRTMFLNVALSSETWWFLCVTCARYVDGVESLDIKKDIFWNPFVDDEEERNLFESPWVLDEHLHKRDFSETNVNNRVKIMKCLVDRLLSTPLLKRSIDISSEARLRISSELNMIEREDRKLHQRIAALHKMIDSGNFEEGMTETQVNEQLRTDEKTSQSLFKLREIADSYLRSNCIISFEPLGEDRLGNIYYSLPFKFNYVVVLLKNPKAIGVFDSDQSLDMLISSMDTRGVKEKHLKQELEMLRKEGDSEPLQHDFSNYSNSRRENAQNTDLDEKLKVSEFLHQTITVAEESFRMLVHAWLDRDVASLGIDHGNSEASGTAVLVTELKEKVENLSFNFSDKTPNELVDHITDCIKKLKHLEMNDFSGLPDILEHLSEILTVALSTRWEVDLWLDETDRRVWGRMLGGSTAALVEGEVMATSASVGLACQFCGQRFVNKLKLSMHTSRWCKLKPDDFVMDAEDPLTSGSCVGRVEKVALPPFPLMSTTRISSAPTTVTISGPFACDLCGKEYNLQSTLASHRTRWCKGSQNTGNKSAEEEVPETGPFVCKYCNKELGTSHGLVVHYSRWCPAKDYGPSMDLMKGFESEESKENVKDDEEGNASDSSEEALLMSEDQRPSFTTLSACTLWLIDRIDAAAADVAEKAKAARRRK